MSSLSCRHPRSSARRSSSRLPTALPLRKELERPIADHDLVATPSAGPCELALDPLLRQPPLEPLDLRGVVEVGLGHPSLDTPAHHAEAFALAPHDERRAGRPEHHPRLGPPPRGGGFAGGGPPPPGGG